jgi:hypothetical protein
MTCTSTSVTLHYLNKQRPLDLDEDKMKKNTRPLIEPNYQKLGTKEILIKINEN